MVERTANLENPSLPSAHIRCIKFLLLLLLFTIFPLSLFSQQQNTTSGIRDYVGLINQTYHPGIVELFEKIRSDFNRQGQRNAVRAIDLFLRGSTGSGFLYSDARGNLYVVTNNHVISQAHTISITFENLDGNRNTIENLTIIATDVENDLAILAFPDGVRPVRQGLTFLTRRIEEGEDVFSAGFPSLGVTPVWQFGRGNVSNAIARFPRSLDDETLMGPFIQHTAQVDPGNSGGPLLVAQRNVPSGYAVAGINTLKATQRQAANYAIPANTAITFINSALNPNPANFRAALDETLEKFIEEISANRAVFPYIAEYLSTLAIGENAEFAINETTRRANNSFRQAYIAKFEENVIDAIGYAVAWTIEDNMRSAIRSGAIRAEIKEITGEGNEYTVVFSINDNDFDSTWIREYGNWRIHKFGNVAGDPEAIAQQREGQRSQPTSNADALRERTESRNKTDSIFHLEAGFATLFSYRPAAVYVNFDFRYAGIKGYIAGSDYIAFGIYGGYRWNIPVNDNKLSLMPFIRAGLDYQYDKENHEQELLTMERVPPITINAQAGIKFTTARGLLFGAGVQYNVPKLLSDRSLMQVGLAFTVGYAF